MATGWKRDKRDDSLIREYGRVLWGMVWGRHWTLHSWEADSTDTLSNGAADTEAAAQSACDAAARDLLREALADIGADDACKGIEIEPGVFSGCDPSRAPPSGNDCPACAERAKGVR